MTNLGVKGRSQPETVASSRRVWERIQRIERSYHQQKDPGRILTVNRCYWRRIIDALPAGELRIAAGTRILDIGCGGAGILLALETGIRTGIDPLMEFYLQKFPFLRDVPIRWLEGRAEELAADEPYDLVFSINMLDHTEDPKSSARNLEKAVAPGGHLVCVLNVHLTRFWQSYFRRFYRFIDPPHPHHLHRDQVADYFSSLRLVQRRDIDALWLDLKEEYDREVLGRRRRGWKEILRSLANPLKYPIAAAHLLGRPAHRRRLDDRPIMATYLYLFASRLRDRHGEQVSGP